MERYFKFGVYIRNRRQKYKLMRITISKLYHDKRFLTCKSDRNSVKSSVKYLNPYCYAIRLSVETPKEYILEHFCTCLPKSLLWAAFCQHEVNWQNVFPWLIVDIDGCETNQCFVGVECFDVPWFTLRPTQREDDYMCGDCPADLRGDGKSCFGRCCYHDYLFTETYRTPQKTINFMIWAVNPRLFEGWLWQNFFPYRMESFKPRT